MLAAAAGLQASPLTPDCTGVDFDLTYPREVDGDFPCMKVQVKSWSRPRRQGEFWRYGGLTEKRFNALAGPRRVPRYLFVVMVPENAADFARADADSLRLHHAAYWMSLEDHKRLDGPRCDRRVEVLIPEANLLTVDTLLDMFDPLRVVEAV